VIGPLGSEPPSRDPSQIVVDSSYQPAVGLPIALSPCNEQRGYVIFRSHQTVPWALILPLRSSWPRFIVTTFAT
jgi:hypothetical protein